MPIIKEKTLEEWDAEIKQHSLHLKVDSQLFFLEESIEAKIPRVAQDLFEHGMFPDAIKREIYFSLVDSGEIAPELLTATKLSLINQSIVDSEYLSRVAFYRDKKTWLEVKLTCCKKEMELRADRLVVRKPKGTKYYIDFTNGHDVNNDGSTPVKSNGDGPWATLNKFTGVAIAGDIGIVRRGMTQAVSADLNFANDGTMDNPIIMEADFDDIWGDEVDLSATALATLTFGSKAVVFSADISGVLAAHDWIYAAGDDTREFAYEVADVSIGNVTLYLPYKGNQTGAGKTMFNMKANPIWNTVAGNYDLVFNADNYWKIQGLDLRSTDSVGVVKLDSCGGLLFKDCIFQGNGTADPSIYWVDDAPNVELRKCRFYNYKYAFDRTEGSGDIRAKCYDCLFDTGLGAIYAIVWPIAFFYDCEMSNHSVGDIVMSSGPEDSPKVYCRNCLLLSATEFDGHAFNFNLVHVEDHDQTIGDNRQLTGLSTAEGTPIMQSEIGVVRAGGGSSSIKCTPSNKLGTVWEFSKVLLFEYPIYAVKDVAKTYTVYFRSDDDTDWDADPLNTELWVEAEYWGHATNVARKITKSTGVCNNFDADDTIWDTLTVTVTPLQTGVLYLRGYYCKTKEAAKSNIFYCDTKVVIS